MGDYLDISAPAMPSTMHMELGQEMDLFWRDKRGMYQVPSRFVGTLNAPHRMWRVEPIAKAEKHQRRRHARAETMLDVEILFMDRDPQLQVQACAIDISESGLRCRTAARIITFSGEVVEVRLTTEGAMRTVAGTILRKDRVKDVTEFVVVLIEPVLETVASAFRREVFRAHRQQRRTQREVAES